MKRYTHYRIEGYGGATGWRWHGGDFPLGDYVLADEAAFEIAEMVDRLQSTERDLIATAAELVACQKERDAIAGRLELSEKERDRLEALLDETDSATFKLMKERDAMRTVVEDAESWRDEWIHGVCRDTEARLINAVDAYRKGAK